MLLTYFQARQILQAIDSRLSQVETSLDLGRTVDRVAIKYDKALFSNGQILSKQQIEKVFKANTSCFAIEGNDIIKIQLFSQKTNKYYKLFPTKTWPTIEISGIRMHCVKDITPKQDTIQKISYIKPCTGQILDTCTGLGYTAIVASETADIIHTYEIDECVIELEKLNPWSAELFNNKKIKRNKGDVFEEVKKLKDNSFDRIIHDPPRLSLATLLYSQELYNNLFRVLKRYGKIFHYTGNPGSKNRGVDLKKNVIKRMSIAGFSGLREVSNAITGEKK